MRNGRFVGEYSVSELPRVKLVAAMLGKDFDDLASIKPEGRVSVSDEIVLDADHLSHKGTIKPFDFKIHKGEVVGVTGLLGSGRSEMVRCIYGADKAQSGTEQMRGKTLKINSPIDSIKVGMGFLPDDRKADGCIGELSVKENIILALQARSGIFKRIPRARQVEMADHFIDLLKIKTASRETPLNQLSGGNQQKVILARWLCTHPDFLILDEPTRGIDIGTKTEFQRLVLQFAAEGMMKDYEFWFVVGSQFLYGPEVLETVRARAKEMAEKLSAAEQIPCKVVYKVTVKTESECTRVMISFAS